MDEIGSFILEQQRLSRGSDERLLKLPEPYLPVWRSARNDSLADSWIGAPDQKQLVRAGGGSQNAYGAKNRIITQFEAGILQREHQDVNALENVHQNTVNELARQQVAAERLGFENQAFQLQIKRYQAQIAELQARNADYQAENTGLLRSLEQAQKAALELAGRVRSCERTTESTLDGVLRDSVVEQLRRQNEASQRLIAAHEDEKRQIRQQCNERIAAAMRELDSEKRNISRSNERCECVQCSRHLAQLEEYEQLIGSLRAQIASLEELLGQRD